ncbi:Dicer-like protein 1 [Mortierella sp. AD032]|nr:Dicer-like protein 1 [Mortierella sp. AD032]
MAARRDVPRKYQLEVAKRAIEKNIIAVSDTGSGKTLISVMLLKNVVAQARQQAKETGCQRKVAFFIVNKVPLVFQQHAYIVHNSDIKAEAICGAMDADNFKEDRWNSIFQEFEVVVITGQILLNILAHAFLKIDLCSILIFDECHHATGKHAYRQIMTMFYPEAQEKPKIFGMTASPPKDKGSATFAATHLEETLDAHIITASYDEVLQYTQRPRERVVYYTGVNLGSAPAAPEDIEREFSRLSTSEQNSCGRLVMMLKEDPKLKPAVQWYQHSLTELGPWFGARSWKYILDILKEDIQDTVGPRRQDRIAMIQNAEQIAVSIEKSRLDIDLTQVTEKVRKLVDILREAGRHPDFCGILFMERRPTTHTMKEFLDQCKGFGPEFGLDFIQSAVLTGHGSKGDVKQHHMNLKAQRKILEGFRNKQFNLLVATDVAEEGLDIDRCRLVIRFDVKNTVISHIQSRGRARDPNSEYIIMLPEQDGYLEKISKAEADMRQWCGGLSAERVIRLQDEEDEDENDNIGLDEMKELANVETTFKVESTGARVNFYTAVSLLHQYCDSLPADAYTSLRPEFKITELRGNYCCELKLPLNAPVIEFQAGPFSQKSLAKQAVSFQAIKELYLLGGLTDRLLPHRRKAVVKGDLDDSSSEEEEDAESTRNGAQGSLRTYPIHQPTFWENKIKVVPGSDSVMLYATLLSLRQPIASACGDGTSSNFRSLCLLTAGPLPQFEPIELFFGGKPCLVDLTCCSNREVSVKQVNHLYQYHKLLFATVFHKSVDIGSLETGVRHLIAPLQRHCTDPRLHKHLSLDQLIDWDEVESGSIAFSTKTKVTATLELQETDLSWDHLQDIVLIEKGQENRFYYPTALRTDLTPNSPIPSSSTIATQTRESESAAANRTFAEYYKSIREKDIRNLHQPLIEVEKFPRSIDRLRIVNSTLPGPKSSAVRFLIPELGQKCPVSGSVLRSAEWMVSALIRIDDLLKTTEFLSEIGHLGQVHLPLMLEALTATDTSYAMNYQRLELLGDTFLKFMMTVDMFIRFPLLDEGRLTMKREARISNSHLFKRAKLFGLNRFLVKLPPIHAHFFVPASAPPSPSTSPSLPGDAPPDGMGLAPSGEVLAASPRDLGQHAATTQPEQPQPQPQQPQPQQRKSQIHQQISKKTMADLVESTLGAAYLSQGFDLGLKVAAALLKPLDGIQTWNDFAKAFSQASDANNNDEAWPKRPYKEDPLLGDLDTVEASIGYRFNNRRLLVEALTHATANDAQTPCYQRLEFLGDSILDMLVADYWVRRYPVSGPGVLHEIKSASINNQILGVLCVQLGLHRNILHFSSSLQADILRATQQIEDAKEDALATLGGKSTTDRGEPVGEYWHDFNMTKVLGDVLESVFGAVFVDSGWDYSVVQGFFDRAVLPTLRDHISIETLAKHPVVTLFHRIQKEGCQTFRLQNLASVTAEEPKQQADSQPSRSSSSSSAVSATAGSPLASSPSTPFLIPPSPSTPLQLFVATTPATPSPFFLPYSSSSYYYKQQRQGQSQDQSDQVCAVMVHEKAIATATNTHIQVARKEAAKRALALFDSDPDWLTTMCTCDNSTTRAKKSLRLESSEDAVTRPRNTFVEKY